jgi:hypothetical protein
VRFLCSLVVSWLKFRALIAVVAIWGLLPSWSVVRWAPSSLMRADPASGSPMALSASTTGEGH